MDAILESCKKVFDRCPRAFGIAHVSLNEDGSARDATIVYLNDAMAATAECEPTDLCGKNIYEVWPDGDRTWLEYYYRAAYHDEAVQFETVSVQYRTFQNVAIFPIAEGYCGYEVQDITSWLEHSHPAMESVSAGMFFYESQTQLMLLTEPARECCGLDAAYMSAREFAEKLFDAEVAARMYESIVDYSSEYERVLCEEQLKNGTWIRMSMSCPTPDGRFAIGFLEDITLLRKAEAASVQRSEIIESLSSEYYALHWIDLDEDTIKPYLLRNEVAVYFAKEMDDDVAYSEWLSYYCERYVVEPDRQRVYTQFEREGLIKRMAEGLTDVSLDCRRLFDDEEQYIELRLVRISGEANMAVLAARNINEEVRRQIDQKEAIQSALILAQHASEAKTTFLTNISHDFRTPLNAIMGFSNLALSHLDDSERVRSSLEKILVSGEHLLDLINDILDVSRIESGKIALKTQPLNVLRLIEAMQNVFSVQAAEKGVAFVVDASGVRHPNVLGDQLRINQILVNTVGNALKYTESGGRVDVIISDGAASPDGRVMLEVIVRDTGCGMSDEFINRIYMPFERDTTYAVDAKEGTGLGMTITKNLVDLIGGTIAVTSEVGKGSEFVITLPLRLDEGRGDGVAAVSTSDGASVHFDGFRALVVDDDELSREMMCGILSDRGFEVEEAADGVEAVEAVERSETGHYDVVIMDMRMPRMTGDEAAQAIRALPRTDVADMPIIAATADAFEEGHRRSREAGMTAHITKPLRTKRLMAILREYLHGA